VKGEGATMRLRFSFFLILLLALLIAAAAFPADMYRLKPGAKGKICTNCHVDFQDKLKRPFLHTPVKQGDCSGCHNPHTSSHGKLLEADPSRICLRCHEGIAPKKAKSTHKVVVEGKCTGCHDPHSADNKWNLVKAGNELCFGCHKDLGQAVTKARFKHSPVEKGCLNCHDPHASEKFGHLLKTDVPALCTNCHKADKPSFTRQHSDYPVAKARCTSCHNPHGSEKAAIMYANVHRPVLSKMCNQCHESPSSPTPFKVKSPGYELCRGCHSKMINETFGKNQLHWALVGKNGCLACHTPHASSEAALLKGPMITVCGVCHADTIKRQETSLTKHEPVTKGECAKCHSPHASDGPLLMTNPSVIDLCGSCHNWGKHSSHPVGEKVRDMRNRNLSVNCLSCHRSHGTPYKKMVPFTTSTDLCVQCHKQ
jgi:predicted CXXCH cytochrome family protein